MAQPEERTVAVFGAYGPRPGDAEYELARETGRRIAEAGWVVMNGGYAGTMEASARGAKEAGGRVIGITVETFSREPNRFTDEAFCTRDLWERLHVLLDRADAYIALPGATGTLAEIGMAWESMCKRIIPPKPLVFLGGFWTPLYELLVPNSNVKAACGGLVRTASTPSEAIDFIASVLKE